MKKIRKKAKNGHLNTSDVEYIIAKIKYLIKENSKGNISVSDDDIEYLEIYKLLLKNYEKKQKSVNLSSNQNIDYHKAKIIVDNLELNRIIAMTSWGMGWSCWFEIIDLSRFRIYVLKLIEEILDKFPNTRFDKIKRIDLKKIIMNPYAYTVIGGLVVLLVWYLFIFPIITNNKIPSANITTIDENITYEIMKDELLIFEDWIYEDYSFLLFDNQVKFQIDYISDFTKSIWLDIFIKDDPPKRITINDYKRQTFEYNSATYYIDPLKYYGNSVYIVITKQNN